MLFSSSCLGRTEWRGDPASLTTLLAYYYYYTSSLLTASALYWPVYNTTKYFRLVSFVCGGGWILKGTFDRCVLGSSSWKNKLFVDLNRHHGVVWRVLDKWQLSNCVTALFNPVAVTPTVFSFFSIRRIVKWSAPIYTNCYKQNQTIRGMSSSVDVSTKKKQQQKIPFSSRL